MPLPSLSPVIYPIAICGECTSQMRIETVRFGKKLSGLILHCDKCGYAHRASLQHIPGESFIPKKVVKP